MKLCHTEKHNQLWHIETDAKRLDWLKIWLLVKNPQFLSNQADIPATSPTHEVII